MAVSRRKSRSRKTKRTAKRKPKPSMGAVRRHYKRLKNSDSEIKKQIAKLESLKKRHVEVVDGFFKELQRNPTQYKHRIKRGRKVREVTLTSIEVRKRRNAFKKSVAKADLAAFVGAMAKKTCPEKEYCVRVNRTPWIFNTCCYLCLSPAVIQCEGDFP